MQVIKNELMNNEVIAPTGNKNVDMLFNAMTAQLVYVAAPVSVIYRLTPKSLVFDVTPSGKDQLGLPQLVERVTTGLAQFPSSLTASIKSSSFIVRVQIVS